MGTNYYLKSNACKECGHCQSEKHIGKSSIGWKFLFRSHFQIQDFDEWVEELNDPFKLIYDEYGRKITLEKFLDLVNNTSQLKSHVGLDTYIYEDNKGYEFRRNEFS